MNIAAKYQKGDVLYAENINSLPLRHLVLMPQVVGGILGLPCCLDSPVK